MTEVGEWIRKRRKEHDMSIAELATAVGVSSGRIEAWEQGSEAPVASLVQNVQTVFANADTRPVWWSEAMRLKDTMPLRELAGRVGVSTGTLSSELKKAGIRRRLRLDPEPSSSRQAGPPMPNKPSHSPNRRHGSKDSQIEQFFHLLGKIPDSEVARLAEVSVRTVASYRARNDIAGYEGPRRRPQARGGRQSKLDDYKHLLGKLPDRVVAEEAGMSLGAVRNYRIKNDIPAAGRMPRSEIKKLLTELRALMPKVTEKQAPALSSHFAPPMSVEARTPTASVRPAAAPAPVHATMLSADAQRAWRFIIENSDQSFIVVAPTLVEAVQRASGAAGGDSGRIHRIESLGAVLSAQA